MNILHIGLASCFTEGMTYQENLLAHQNVLDGHKVTFVSNASKYINGSICDVEEQSLLLPDGMKLIRLKYRFFFNRFFTSKMRVVKGLYNLIKCIEPDVIFCHELASKSAYEIIKYIKKHPSVRFYVDFHTAFHNSGRNWLSLNILHKMIYRPIYRKSIKYVDKYFYIGIGEKEFANKVYKIPNDNFVFFPLGGNPYDEKKYIETRTAYRSKLGLRDDELLLLHSGKIDVLKNTCQLLRAFIGVPTFQAKLVIIGSISNEIEQDVRRLIDSDKRISFLGWKSGNELMDYLCAADVYCQPGSVSAVLQNAICQGCAVMSYPHKSYVETINMNQFIWVKNEEEIKNSFMEIQNGSIDINKLKANSKLCGATILNYKNIAKLFTE